MDIIKDTTLADAGLLRGLATDVEEDRGYVTGSLIAKRLRGLADHIEQPLHGALMRIADKIQGKRATVLVRYVEQATGEADIVLDIDGGVHLLTDMQPLSRKSVAGGSRGAA